jgi:hypothetical protein
VLIHTGRGTTRAGHLYLGSGRPIWNNHGDTATLIDPSNVNGWVCCSANRQQQT